MEFDLDKVFPNLVFKELQEDEFADKDGYPYCKTGVYVPLGETLRGFDAIIKGEMDHLPEAAFFNVGTMDDIYAKAAAIERGEI